MNKKQFEFSLLNVKHSDWSDFERLSSAFLVDDYGDMRTMAAPSGDGGRDSELFNSIAKPIIVAQYSVAQDWKSKIRRTVTRLEENYDSIRFLIYMTSQEIGAAGDQLKTEIFNKGISLDIRDRNWFAERCETTDTRQTAVEEFVNRIGRPILAGEGLIESGPSQFSSKEAKTALLFLNLQLHDDINQKSLTKSVFEALVRSVLRGTNSENRKTRDVIYEEVGTILPNTSKDDVQRFTDKALRKLTKQKIRHWAKEDEFCLTHKEYEDALEAVAKNQLIEEKINQSIVSILSGEEVGIIFGDDEIFELARRARRILDVFLMKLGEEFATAVVQGRVERIETSALNDIILSDINTNTPSDVEKNVEHYPATIGLLVREILGTGAPEIKLHLRNLSDSYTLFAFMKETPDVKKVTQLIFSHGTIWLDTSVVLPFIAESLLEDPLDGRITNLLKTAHAAKIQFKVTTGVLEEIQSHMESSSHCSKFKHADWIGKIPYLFYKFTCSGHPANEFDPWITNFKGNERPVDDLLEYLKEELSVERHDLAEELEKIEDSVRHTTSRLWEEKHRVRRANAGLEVDENVTRQLIDHDIENYLGVIALRNNESNSELGYKHWLLTFDSNAWQIRDELKKELSQIPTSPLISLDFLSRNLSIGPSREGLSKEDHEAIPLIYGFEMNGLESPNDLLEVASTVRAENASLSERVLRRKVRDACDKERRRKTCAIKDAGDMPSVTEEL